VKKWVPELSHLPLRCLHAPWTAEHPNAYPDRIVEDVDVARASFVAKACESRSKAPAHCFSKDGCDLLTLPRTAGLPGEGIWALTERCFKGEQKRHEDRASGKGKGKGKGSQRSSEEHHVDSVQRPKRRWNRAPDDALQGA